MADSGQFTFTPQPKPADWQCHLFCKKPGPNGMIYRPVEGNVPNAFVRFMMRVCLGCHWVRDNG